MQDDHALNSPADGAMGRRGRRGSIPAPPFDGGAGRASAGNNALADGSPKAPRAAGAAAVAATPKGSERRVLFSDEIPVGKDAATPNLLAQVLSSPGKAYRRIFGRGGARDAANDAPSPTADREPAGAPEDHPADASDEEIAAVDGIIVKLKAAKRHLKEKDNDMALSEFDEALKEINANEGSLAEAWKARRKAHRGRGAALERLGRYGEALEAMQTVLSLSVDHDDHSGETDALGVIADIYTDMDQLEIASEYYDRYFQSLQEEDALNAAKEAAEEKAVAR